MIAYGHERVTLHRQDWRWWVYIEEDIEPLLRRAGWSRGHARPATPGVFHFARGGRADSETDAHDAVNQALHAAHREAAEYAHRPTHALGRRGELIPLVPTVPEIEP